MNDNILYFYCDGGCAPTNPGGYILWSWSMVYQDRARVERYGHLPKNNTNTNFLAEYQAILEALIYAVEYKDRIRRARQSVVLRVDSKTVVNQLNGSNQCKAEHLIPFWKHARQLMRDLNATIEWIPREQNQRADELCGLAYEEATR